MKIIEASSKVVQCKQSAGLFLCQMEHEVKSTKANFDWQGPKISAEVWHQVLAFFRWSHDKTKSETQVRLFVNAKHGQWAAWAFPQICGTGMTTKEISEGSDEWNKQRSLFKDSAGWMPFGTVHHHCTAGASQSGVDKDNEQGQDGLHITVGHMNSKSYDIHARFYLSGSKFTPDLNVLWDIGNVMDDVPDWARSLLPADTEHRIAESQMCEPAPEETEFPDEWKANLIEEKRPEIHSGLVQYSPSFHKSQGYDHQLPVYRKNNHGSFATDWDIKRALVQFKDAYGSDQLSDIYLWLASFLEDDDFLRVHEILADNDVSPQDLMRAVEEDIANEELKGAVNDAPKQLNDPTEGYMGMMGD